jgi:Xaa-Pro aminopeptidase
MKTKIKQLCDLYNAESSTSIEKIPALQKSDSPLIFIFTSPKDTFYLTQAHFDGFYLLIIKETVYILCSKMVENQVKDFFGTQAIVKVVDNFMDEIVKILSAQPFVQQVIIDSQSISAKGYSTLKEKLSASNIELILKDGILDKIRMVKTDSEIENIRQACKIVSKVCSIIKEELRPGISELDIYYRIIELFAQNRVEISFTPIVAAGANSANPHHASSNYKIQPSDPVLIDIGCKYNGFCSDLTRTYLMNRISSEKRRVWDIVKEAQNAVISQIKAGFEVKWADETARKIIDDAGYKDNFTHSTGHSIGIEVHEPPSLNKKAEGFFLSNMIVTVEPGIYLNGQFGVRIEDTVLIKDKGCEILTDAPY